MPKLVQYYRVQSCGPSKYGYHSPCHVGKIRREDGGDAVPITGGWHAAHDHQRDVTEILHGAFGLLYLALARPEVDGDWSIFNEVRWGNDYFLAIQSRDGFLYEGVSASEYFKWNEKDWWDSDSYVLSTQPAQLYSQHNFITIQALIARHYRKRYPEYASRCLEAGQRCFEYVKKQRGKSSGSEAVSYDLGTGVLAGVHMFRATGGEPYRTYATEMASRLVAVQAPDGYWIEKQASVSESLLYTPFAAIGLSAAARWLSEDPDRARWMAALEKFASNFVKPFSNANAFGILPCRIYPDRAPQKARVWKTQQYRYFIETNYSAGGAGYKFYWQTGNIASVSGYGVAMVYLSEILRLHWLRKLAQRQLDWVLGVNPFDASMVLGVGRNQPPTYPSKEMVPGVPDIEGAVL